MDALRSIVARRSSLLAKRDTSMSPGMMDGIITLMSLIFVALLLVAVLYIVRKVRKSRAIQRQQLPQYNSLDSSRRSVSNHRRLTITASPYGRASSIYVYDEKASMMSNSSGAPLSPDDVPEIRITFPDEQDESGRPQSGRVVIVRVGENGIGLEPLKDEQLPAYEKESGERFHSIDMERIGGLTEKSEWK